MSKKSIILSARMKHTVIRKDTNNNCWNCFKEQQNLTQDAQKRRTNAELIKRLGVRFVSFLILTCSFSFGSHFECTSSRSGVMPTRRYAFHYKRSYERNFELWIVPIFCILWRIYPLLRGASVNNSRCYGAPADYVCALTSHNNRRGDAGGVSCRSLWGYMTRPTVFCWVSAM
jgi:hypothetical protein